MVGKKHQCKTSWMCGVIKTKSRESVGCKIMGIKIYQIGILLIINNIPNW
jgi:hypothetical protein